MLHKEIEDLCREENLSFSLAPSGNLLRGALYDEQDTMLVAVAGDSIDDVMRAVLERYLDTFEGSPF